MKKIITVAALIAAGTLLGNAASVIVDVNGTDFSIVGNTATLTFDNLTFTVTASGTLATSVTKSTDAAKAGWYDSSKDLLFTGDNAWGKAASSTYLVSPKSGSSSLTVKISGYEANQSGIDLSFVAGVPFEGAGSWASYATLSGVNSSVSGSVSYVANSASVVTTTELPAASGTIAPFSAAIYSFSGLTADDDGSISFVVDGIDAHSAGLSAIKVSAVPEPSAFGLLAGAGALAFVAARRRRRAK